ncbi:50S ribosomal protein L6 [Monoraphidium neglectum]|uniref:Large ribosomal subunit protein uL6c n=1 Tax=Monoraphidium neglectum TaxID=145388 RepID=A0A0D2MGM1_9CHLO|nr:50S ribosomal protein L6 [Monoraphidium neglectum]KIZ02220.1 50S ribosomal protein L6 [Monoraphidium neglectum]|eukprot:XP_013901239.1 50S ribosomal protein L6 [Monoraphidium neglectum]
MRAAAFSSGCRSRTALNVVCKESRIGSKPIPVPKGVTVDLKGSHLKVKGPKGELELTLTPYVTIEQTEGKLLLKRAEETKKAAAMHGLSRTLASNIVVGVSEGFEKKLELVGTGYRAAISGQELTLNLGYSKPRILTVPDGIKVTVEKTTAIFISGADKVAVGDFCALVRRQRPPEPYKGKGVRYSGEVIKLKEGKTGKK